MGPSRARPSGIEVSPALPASPPASTAVSSYRVRVLGRPVRVERYGDLSYVRFAMRGPAEVEIEAERSIRDHWIFPAQRVASVRAAGNGLALELPSPDSVVISIPGLEQLVLLPDPPDDDEPRAGTRGVVDVTEVGADPTGGSLATETIQAALDRAAGMNGGGTVLVPPGTYRTGTLVLGSDVTFHVAAGALVQGSPDPADYPVDPGRRETAADASLPPDVRYFGRTMTFSRLLLVDRAENVRIAGHGTIDGNGTFLRTRHGAAPNLLRVRESRHVTVSDVLFRDSAAWTIHVLASRHVAFRNVKVINDRTNLNTDGIDPDMSSDVAIERSFIRTKDDAVCVKATRNSDLSGEVRRIVVRDCLVSSLDAALKLGSESDAATFSDVVFEDDFVYDSGRAMSVVVRDGATYERVAFRRIHVGPNVDHLVEQAIAEREPTNALGTIRDLLFEDVEAPSFRRPDSNRTWYSQFRPGRDRPDPTVNVFEGADPVHAVDGLTLRRIVVNGTHLSSAAMARRVANLTIGPHVRGVRFD